METKPETTHLERPVVVVVVIVIAVAVAVVAVKGYIFLQSVL